MRLLTLWGAIMLLHWQTLHMNSFLLSLMWVTLGILPDRLFPIPSDPQHALSQISIPPFPPSLMPLNNLVDGLWWALWKGIIDAVTFAKWPVTSCEWVSAAGASLSSCCPPRRASFRNLLFSSPPAGQEYVKGEHENTRKRGRFYARIRLIKAKLTFLDSFPRMLLEL
jgi:hypothetical protein